MGNKNSVDQDTTISCEVETPEINIELYKKRIVIDRNKLL